MILRDEWFKLSLLTSVFFDIFIAIAPFVREKVFLDALEFVDGISSAVRRRTQIQKPHNGSPRHVSHRRQKEHRRPNETLVARQIVLEYLGPRLGFLCQGFVILHDSVPSARHVIDDVQTHGVERLVVELLPRRTLI